VAAGGVVYHVLNRARANARAQIFDGDADYAASERVPAEAAARTATRLLAYCVMPNHWHLLAWPRRDGALSAFARWLTVTHTRRRWHAHRHTAGGGHLYQGRFKSFPVQADAHFPAVARYVERNALRAGLVGRAEDWRWCGVWHRNRRYAVTAAGTATAAGAGRRRPSRRPSRRRRGWRGGPAGAAAGRLAGVGERAADRRRVGGGAGERAAGPAVRGPGRGGTKPPPASARP
jgi:REP element-mobilizing transposase RayT